MGIARLLVPVHPSVLSALGMLMTDVKDTRVLTRVVAAGAADGAVVERTYRDLEADLAAALGPARASPPTGCASSARATCATTARPTR